MAYLSKDKYDFIHDATPHRQVDDYQPVKKPIIAYKQFKMSLDENGNNISKGIVYPLYVNTSETGTDGGLKIGVWYKSGTGRCWQIKTPDAKGKRRYYTLGDGYNLTGEKKLGRLSYRSGWHFTSTPWGNQRGTNGHSNRFKNSHNIEVWAECEICVDNDKTEEARLQGKIAKDQCFSEVPNDSFYRYKTNPNASDAQQWYIADKMRILRILSDDEVDRLNDEFFSKFEKQGYRIHTDPDTYNTHEKNTIPYWKMPRLNGKRYSQEDIKDMGYNDAQATELDEQLYRRAGSILKAVITEAMKDTFSLEELSSLNSYSKRVQYCKSQLGMPIGNGSSRMVFQIDDEKCLKLAKNEKGIAQNEEESQYYLQTYGIMPKVFETDNDSKWIVSEYVLPAKAQDFQHCLGMSFQKFCEVVKAFYLSYARRTPYLSSSISYDELVEIVENSEWLASLESYMGDYQLPFGDLTRLANFGLVQRDGEPEIVILDSGLSQDIYDRYYRR